jgi:hypothetical protein
VRSTRLQIGAGGGRPSGRRGGHAADDGVVSISCDGCPGRAQGACEDCLVTALAAGAIGKGGRVGDGGDPGDLRT